MCFSLVLLVGIPMIVTVGVPAQDWSLHGQLLSFAMFRQFFWTVAEFGHAETKP